MKQFSSKLLLFTYGLGAFLFLHVNDTLVAACFCSITISSLCYYFSSKRTCRNITLLFCIASLLLPEFCFFLPLILYDIFMKQGYLTYIVSTFALLHFISVSDIRTGIFILFGCAFSLLLGYHANAYENLESQLKVTRDDSTELTLLLKEKNKTLLEKQNYEIYNATLKERNRIAREIHDNVGHLLSRSILMTGALKTIHKSEPISQSLEQLSDTLSTAMDSIRESVHDLHNESINLKESLSALIDEFNFCEIHLKYDMSEDIPGDVKLSFISIIKEALSNIIRHSDASHVYITVREHPGFYQLIIEDNGNVTHSKMAPGMGLSNMRERIDLLNGTFRIHDTSGFGIFITVPKTNET